MKVKVKYWKKIISALVVILFLAALWIFWLEIRGMTLSGFMASLSKIQPIHLLLSFAAVAGSYWLTTIIEKYAVLESGLSIPYPRIARISFVSSAIGASVGALVSGAPFRYRYYSQAGARPSQIGRIVAVTQLAVWAGAALLNGLVLLIWPKEVIGLIRFPSGLRYLLALGCLALPAFFVLMSLVAQKKKDFTIYGRVVPIPAPKIIVRQLAAGFFGPPATALVLFFLLPASHGTNFLIFCGVFALSSIAGAVSMVPAGIGVFEASLVWMLHSFYDRAELLSALLLYRLLNNLVPFVIAAVLLLFDTFRTGYIRNSMTIVNK